MEPHSGQKVGRLILLTFPFSLQCDSLPPARATATHAYLQTDLSLHYPACLLLLALACKGETRLQGVHLLSPSAFLSHVHKHCHNCTDQTCQSSMSFEYIFKGELFLYTCKVYEQRMNVKRKKQRKTRNKNKHEK